MFSDAKSQANSEAIYRELLVLIGMFNDTQHFMYEQLTVIREHWNEIEDKAKLVYFS